MENLTLDFWYSEVQQIAVALTEKLTYQLGEVKEKAKTPLLLSVA